MCPPTSRKSFSPFSYLTFASNLSFSFLISSRRSRLGTWKGFARQSAKTLCFTRLTMRRNSPSSCPSLCRPFGHSLSLLVRSQRTMWSAIRVFFIDLGQQHLGELMALLLLLIACEHCHQVFVLCGKAPAPPWALQQRRDPQEHLREDCDSKHGVPRSFLLSLVFLLWCRE